MNKIERTQNALLRRPIDKYPIFISSTPQFLQRAVHAKSTGATALEHWQYCRKLNLDIIQVGHPSFYPVKVMELPRGSRYVDEFQRTHQISEYYDDFIAPFPLQPTNKVDIPTITEKWYRYKFPDPTASHWFTGLDTIVQSNKTLSDPLAIWGVINGPFEPTWQLLSDGWPAFYILARRNEKLALEILDHVSDYCIQAGQELIRRGANAIRIGDDYALNEGVMAAPEIWHRLIYPAHKKLVAGLKKVGGSDFPVILHSDGNIMAILKWLGEGGLDAINPIQPDALDFETVVTTIGHKLAITAAFDLRFFLNPLTQESQQRMKDEIIRLFGIMEKYNSSQHRSRTGYCIAPTHQIQAGSYVETFEKWVELVHQLNPK